VGLGFLLALILFFKPPLSRFFRTIWFVPILVSGVVIGVVFRWIYNYDWGPLVVVFRTLGMDKFAVNYLGSVKRVEVGNWSNYLPLVLLIPSLWLLMTGIKRKNIKFVLSAFLLAGCCYLFLRFPSGIINIPLFAIIGVITWKFIGFNMVIFLAAMSSIPDELVDAAKIDGANSFQIFWHVIVPLMRVVIINLFILSWVGKMLQFDLVWVLTRGGPIHLTETIATYVQKRAFEWRTLDLGYPSALAVLWFLVVFLCSILFLYLFQTDEVIER
jgi:ABC-type sugar transport system permease subunit